MAGSICTNRGQVICHCLTCRKLTGSPYLACCLVPDDAVKVNVAPPQVTEATHEVGMKLQFYGCDNCPTTIYKKADGMAGFKIVFAGTLDGKDAIETEGKPEAGIWVKYRAPWLSPIAGCEQFEEFAPPPPSAS